jgi:flavin reductase (DIM6/NTAB) family NADH-FMN oxidoreductase RutF
MITINPTTTAPAELHQYMLGAIVPRPIAFVSTINEAGIFNVAPFSFFNCFSINPPILAFSASLRGTDGTQKDTLLNIKTVGECVINVVPHGIVHQVALAGVEFPHGVSEFDKTGLTPIPSNRVTPPRVKESPIQLECTLEQIIPLGTGKGAGNLVICRMIWMHLDPNILDERGRIDPHKVDLMGRMGRSYYSRSSAGVSSIVRPYKPVPIGYDGLPKMLRESNILTGNDLAQLGGLLTLPLREEVKAVRNSDIRIQKILASKNRVEGLHLYAHEVLATGDTALAAKIALLAEDFVKQ